MKQNFTIHRALISVSDKTNILPFAKFLHEQDIKLIATGGTATLLKENGVPITEVTDITGFPEIMDGRVKTLHPKIHGGLLARGEQDKKVLDDLGISPINLLIVNLYPFQKIIQQKDCDLQTAIEHIDIGGPAMLRAAAKNYTYVTVVSDPNDYTIIMEELKRTQSISEKTRYQLAQKAFQHTAQYDAAIAQYLSKGMQEELFPDTYNLQFIKQQDLRYGENPQQKAAFYKGITPPAGTIAQAKQLQGKQLSFNNIVDADLALQCVQAFNEEYACVIVKHATPCGLALASSQETAYRRAFATDPTSAFGGIIAFNQPLSAKTAQLIIENQFAEVIIAPAIDKRAIDILSKKPNIRLLSIGERQQQSIASYNYKSIQGGFLVQEYDQLEISQKQLEVVSDRTPSKSELEDLLFAWKVVKFVKSNAIVYVKDLATIGIGAGQTSRIDSAMIGQMKAEQHGFTLEKAVMASDAFFPFRDSIDVAAKHGITAIIHPGGSIRDKEVIAAANEANIAMVLTHQRHFSH